MDLLVKKSILKHAIWLSSIILPIQTPDQSFSVLNWMYNVRKRSISVLRTDMLLLLLYIKKSRNFLEFSSFCSFFYRNSNCNSCTNHRIVTHRHYTNLHQPIRTIEAIKNRLKYVTFPDCEMQFMFFQSVLFSRNFKRNVVKMWSIWYLANIAWNLFVRMI